MTMPEASSDDYLKRLRRCLAEPAALQEQATKHFTTFGRGAPTIGYEETMQSWTHMHASLNRSCGPAEVASLQSLFTAHVGPPDRMRFDHQGFVRFYVEMLRTLVGQAVLTSPANSSVAGPTIVPSASGLLAFAGPRPPPGGVSSFALPVPAGPSCASPRRGPSCGSPRLSCGSPRRAIVHVPLLVAPAAAAVPMGSAVMMPTQTLPSADSVADAGLPETLGQGRFRVEKRLGKGAFGEVFKAVELASSRRFAIKRMTKASSDLKEFAVLRELTHPNVLQASDQFEDEANLYVVTEFIPGGSLADRLKAHSKTDVTSTFLEPWTAAVFQQVLAGVSYCHAQGVVHNDLKPDNIFLSQLDGKFPRVVVADFGLASAAFLAGRTDGPPGDPRYAPPEAWEVQAHASHKGVGSLPGDVWMLGCTLFELLSKGSLPFIMHRHTELQDFLSWMRSAPRFRFNWVMSLKTTEPNWEAITTAAGTGPRPSAASVDCCGQMLMKDPARRPPCTACAEHPWFEDQHVAGQQGKSKAECIAEEARRRIIASNLTKDKAVGEGKGLRST